MNITEKVTVHQSEQQIYKLVKMLLEVGDEQLRFMQSKNLVSPLTGLPLNYYQTVKANNHFK